MTARPGRRRGKPDTRGAILRAARECFARCGFRDATVRMIAAEARVDPAMINHYFGSKDQLFLATIDIPIDPRAVARHLGAGGLETLGMRFAEVILASWESPARPSLVAALRGALSDPALASAVRDFLFTQIVGRVLRQVGCPPEETELRSVLIASQMMGLLVGRYVLQIEPFTSLSNDALVAAVGPTLQRYLTDPLPE